MSNDKRYSTRRDRNSGESVPKSMSRCRLPVAGNREWPCEAIGRTDVSNREPTVPTSPKPTRCRSPSHSSSNLAAKTQVRAPILEARGIVGEVAQVTSSQSMEPLDLPFHAKLKPVTARNARAAVQPLRAFSGTPARRQSDKLSSRKSQPRRGRTRHG